MTELLHLGNEAQKRGDFAKAQVYYEEAVRRDPSDLASMANLATMLSAQNKLDAAEALLRRIVVRAPNDSDQWLALGNVLMRQEKLDECLAPLNKALELRRENPDIHVNLAAAAYRKREFDTAERLLRHVLSLGATHHSTWFDLAHVMLAQGNLDNGLELYENRWHTLAHSEAWDHHIPEWRGEDLTNKHLLISAEQGFGDMIMLSRFIESLDADEVYIAVPSSMTRLFATQCWGIDVFDLSHLPVDLGEMCDYHVPMFDLMRWLKVVPGEIDPTPYLVSPANGPVVPKTGAFNVGICWASGNHGTKNNWRRRVTDLSLWLPLAEVPGVRLWSLQIDTGKSDIAACGAGGLVCDYMDRITDWADTAALVNQLDLVISVDTGIVHLAGALGVPVWMLSQKSPCWRWWNIARGSGLPWYEDFQIYWRESADYSWQSLLKRAKADLSDLTSTVEVSNGTTG